MQVLSAYTREIDNTETAVAEILEQLDLNQRLLRNSVGIVYYHADFSAALKLLCSKLPFPVLGGTTSNSAVPGSPASDFYAIAENASLTITVLTGDDCEFTAGISGPLQEDPYQPAEKLYRELLASRPESAPAMFFIMTPHLLNITGDDYLAALNGISGGVPVFGSAAYANSMERTRVSFNGTEYRNALGLIAFWGKIKPRFFLSGIPGEHVYNRTAVITDVYKNKVLRINGLSAIKYLVSIGLLKNEDNFNLEFFPLIVRLNDGSRIVRVVYGMEDGALLCSGAMPLHAAVDFSFCDKDFVLESAKETAAECARQIGEESGGQGIILAVSCAAREWTLGADIYAEINEIDRGLARLPYHAAYSSGEFCPVLREGRPVNYFFNYSMCICAI